MRKPGVGKRNSRLLRRNSRSLRGRIRRTVGQVVEGYLKGLSGFRAHRTEERVAIFFFSSPLHPFHLFSACAFVSSFFCSIHVSEARCYPAARHLHHSRSRLSLRVCLELELLVHSGEHSVVGLWKRRTSSYISTQHRMYSPPSPLPKISFFPFRSQQQQHQGSNPQPMLHFCTLCETHTTPHPKLTSSEESSHPHWVHCTFSSVLGL